MRADRHTWMETDMQACVYACTHTRTHTYINIRIVFFSGCGKWPITHKETAKLLRTQRGLNSQSSDRGNIVSCQLSSTFDSRHRDCANKHSPKGGDNPSEWTCSTSVYAHNVQWHRETRKQTNTLHLCWQIWLLHADLNRTCSHSGCDKNCQKLIHQWLSTTAQWIESSGYRYAMYSEWSTSYPDETDTDVSNRLIVLISALVLPFIYTLRHDPRHGGTYEGKRACLTTCIQAREHMDIRIPNCFGCDYLYKYIYISLY